MCAFKSIEVEGRVIKQILPYLFSVNIGNGKIISAHLSGSLYQNNIRLLPGQTVLVEMMPMDPHRGRIIRRTESSQLTLPQLKTVGFSGDQIPATPVTPKNTTEELLQICKEANKRMAKVFQPHQIRAMVKPGTTVDVVLKKDQPTGKLTRGVVKAQLTNSKTHPKGIKVQLQDGQVGRVQAIIQD